MRMKNKKWSIPFLNEHKEIVLYEVSYDNELLKDFINHQPLYLEIGTGKGDFILNMAINNPNTHFIGIEKSITCLAITAKKIVNEDIKNILLIADDVSKVFAYLPQGSIDKLFLNFSDPWPKKRHEKRRLTYKTFLDEYKKILKSNGEIIMKTDNIDLFNYSIESFTSNGFILEQVNFDYDGLDTNDVMTEYERFFRDEGTKINKLVAKVGSNNEIK